MKYRNSTLVVLLVGALGLSSAYYFPDGPPNSRPGRPARQAGPGPSQEPPVPEPKIELEPPVIPFPTGEPVPDNRPGRPAIAPDSHPGRPAIAPENHPGRPAIAPEERPGRPAFAPDSHPGRPAIVPEPDNRPGRPAIAPDSHPGRPAIAPDSRPGRPAIAPEERPGRPAIVPENRPGRPAIAPEERPGRPAIAPENRPGRPAIAPEERPGRPAIAPDSRPGRPAIAPEERPGRPAIAPEERPGRPAIAPENRPGRPARQEPNPSPVPIPLREARHVIDMPFSKQEEPQPRQEGPGPGDEPKPEPRFDILQIVPRRKEMSIQSKQASTCQMNYAFAQTGQSATIQSPGYPNEYPNNVQSSLCFSSPSGTQMKIACADFNLEYQGSCSYDSLGVSQSGSPSSVTKYCGKGSPTTTSTSNSLAIVFSSDASNPGASSRSPYRFSCTITVSGSSTPTTSTTTTTTRPPTGGGSSNCTCGQRNTRIVGGTDARPNSLPWRCYLKTSRYSFFCGCSVISNNWIMTAAHCTRAVMPLPAGDTLFVVVGDHDRSTSTDAASQQIAVTSYTDHPNYNENTMDNDMSLLKLSRAITTSNTISPVCLPWNYASDNFSGTTVTASGWGTTTQGGSVSNTLKEVDLPVLTTEQCATYMPGQVTQNMICTYQPGKDTCQGDSGGSIDLARGGRYYAIGVVSWGIGCAKENYPGVYAKTTKYLDWIQTTTNDNFCKA